MTINFNLFTPAKKVSAVRVVINHKGKAYRRTTGISVNTSEWSVKKQRCTDARKENMLRGIKGRLQEHLNEFSSPEDIQSVLEWALSGSTDKYSANMINGRAYPSFWEHFKNYAERPIKSKRVKMCLYNKVKSLMGTSDNWDDIDSAWYFRFVKAMENDNLTKNSQGTIVSFVKSAMREGVKLKYHKNLDFVDFKRPSEDIDSVYLTEDELKKLWEVELVSPRQKKARDLFLLGVYTASRVSDCSRFSIENIVGDTFRFTQQKTGQSVIMPLSPKVKLLLDRNGGKAPNLHIATYDMEIKNVCRLAGICQMVEVTRTVGKTPMTRRLPKCQFVGSHTARRTGATLLYMSGVPMKSCMYITGHKTEANFMKYIRLTKEENARQLASNAFFQ